MVPRVTLGVALLGAVAATMQAQQPTGSIRGDVVDAATALAVPGALVRIVEAHREEPTHQDGAFHFDGLSAGTYTLLVRAIGFLPHSRRVTVTAGAIATVRVSLEATVIQLAPTVVTGTLGERSSDDALSSITAVSGAELDRRLAGTVAAVLDGEPGVAVTSLGPATARPVIRGLGGDRIVMLEDGQRPGDMSSMSGGDHAVALEPATARRVEVVRGPMGLLYGSSALGGVVNLIREEIPSGLPEHLHGEMSVHGTAGTPGVAGTAWATARAGRFALRGEASGRGWSWCAVRSRRAASAPRAYSPPWPASPATGSSPTPCREPRTTTARFPSATARPSPSRSSSR